MNVYRHFYFIIHKHVIVLTVEVQNINLLAQIILLKVTIQA